MKISQSNNNNKCKMDGNFPHCKKYFTKISKCLNMCITEFLQNILELYFSDYVCYLILLTKKILYSIYIHKFLHTKT